MHQSGRENLVDHIHWTTSDEMLFTRDHKYNLQLLIEFPLRIVFYQFTAAHPIVPNYHDFYEIGYFSSGKGIFYFADAQYEIVPGSITLIPAGQMHYVDADPEDTLRTVSVYFMPELVYHPGFNSQDYQYLLPFYNHGPDHPPVLQEAVLEFSVWKHILNMYQLVQEKNDFYQLMIKNQLCGLLIRFLQNRKQQGLLTENQPAPVNKIKRLEKAFEYIKKEYATEISLEEIADRVSMSPSYFCRYFKQVTGLSLVQYIQRYRVDQAKELLVNTDLSVTEIAFQIGFNSQSYFDRIFQRLTRTSPGHFRQSCRNQDH